MAIKRKTPLRRHTPLRAKHHIRRRSPTAPTLPPGFREEAWVQSEGRCDKCHQPITPQRGFVVHHVFFKSVIRAPLGHELWNRAVLHATMPSCHDAISFESTPHNSAPVREQLEQLAFERLWKSLKPAERRHIVTTAQGRSWRHYVRAYELMRRAERTIKPRARMA